MSKPPHHSSHTPTVSRPAQPFQSQHLQQPIRKQAWLVLVLLLIGLVIDWLSGHTNWLVSKNLLAGSVLAWVGQLVFVNISLSLSGYRQRRKIVQRFYAAHSLKWVVTLIGFAIIFKTLKPLQPLSVMLGFMTLQVSYMILMYRQRSTVAK